MATTVKVQKGGWGRYGWEEDCAEPNDSKEMERGGIGLPTHNAMTNKGRASSTLVCRCVVCVCSITFGLCLLLWYVLCLE